jgi:branched-chain amino acid transport system substrate-binding protein
MIRTFSRAAFPFCDKVELLGAAAIVMGGTSGRWLLFCRIHRNKKLKETNVGKLISTKTNLKKRELIAGRALLMVSLLGSASAEAQTCEVKLGAVGPMSGGAAAWGLAAKAGAEFAAATVNEEGGLPMGNRKCRVKVVSFDSLYTAAGGAAASNYLASENVHAVLGPVTAPETIGFRPGAKRNGQVAFHSALLTNALTPAFPLEFHALQTASTWGATLVKAAVDQFKFKNVVIVGPNDQGGTDGSRQLLKQYAAVGIKGTEEYYQRGTTNFAAIAARIMNARPEAIETSTTPPQDVAVLVKALMEAGYTGAIGALGGAGVAPILKGAGGAEKFKALYWLEVSPIDHPGIVKLKSDYQRLMKAQPPENPLFPVFALAAEIELRGISNAGTDQDPARIAEALRKATPESRYMGRTGWRGKAMYGLNQELSFPVGLGLVIDGKRMPVRTIKIASE